MKPKFWLMLGGVALGVVQLTACSSDFTSCTESRSCPSGGAAGAELGGDAGNDEAGGSDVEEPAGRGGMVGSGAAGQAGELGEAGSGGVGPIEDLAPALFGRCSVKGALACEGHGVAQRLACDGASWQAASTCGRGKLCDSETGACADAVPECADAEPGAVVCREDAPLTCGPDRVTASAGAACAGICKAGVCQAPACGDGKLEKGEECELLAGTVAGACVECKTGVCGDGVVYEGKEQCDDGKLLPGHGCSASCAAEPIALALGAETTCALGSNGVVKCWGSNEHGVLGLGIPGDQLVPDMNAVSLGKGRTAKAISARDYTVCAVLDNGDLKCWGDNRAGQLGTNDLNDIGAEQGEMGDALKPVFRDGEQTQAVSVGGHVCALLVGGAVKCWGRGLYGPLGQDNADDVFQTEGLSPINLGSTSTAKQVTAGTQFSCALLADDSVKCWGHAYFGELAGLGQNIAGPGGYELSVGDSGGELATLTPLPFPAGRHAISIASGSRTSCAVLDDGSVSCWGENSNGVGGAGTKEPIRYNPNSPGPLPIVDLAGRKVKSLSLNSSHACVLLETGAVKCWGANSEGQLGIGSIDSVGDEPGEMGTQLKAVPLGRTALRVATGGFHSCAILDDGTVRCWGLNNKGQLGTGDTTSLGNSGELAGVKLKKVELSF